MPIVFVKLLKNYEKNKESVNFMLTVEKEKLPRKSETSKNKSMMNGTRLMEYHHSVPKS